MSNGVQYNINVVTGNSTSALDGVISLLRESVVQTNAVAAAVSSFSGSATEGFSGVESAVNNLARDMREGLATQTAAIVQRMDDAAGGTNRFGTALQSLGNKAFALNNIKQALDGVKQVLGDATKPGIEFNDAVTQLAAVSGVGETGLKQIQTSSRDLAKEYGVSATKVVEGSEMMLNKLGTELADSPTVLSAMTEQAVILSKQMGGDVSAATDLLTTAMNQMGVSIKDPQEALKNMTAISNDMSAAVKYGSAELPDLKAGIEGVGGVAKTANISLIEQLATLETLDKNGIKAAEGATAMRNAISIFSEGRFTHPRVLEALSEAHISIKSLSDTSIPFAKRLEALKPITSDLATMTLLFGKENLTAGVALVKNTDYLEDLTGKVKGTTASVDFANIRSGSYAEQQKRTAAAIDDMGISIFNVTKGFLPYLNFGFSALSVTAQLGQSMAFFGWLADTKMVKAIAGAAVQFGTWIATTISATAAQWGWNIALNANPIGLVVLAIAAAVTAVVLLVKYWDVIWTAVKDFGIWVWNHTPFMFLIHAVENIFPGFKKVMGELWDWIVGKFEALVGWFKKAWDWIKGLFGGGKSEAADAGKAAVEAYGAGIKENMPGIDTQAVVAPVTPQPDLKPKHHKGDGTSKEMATNVSSGGSRPTTINLTIHKMQDQIVVHTTNLSMGAKEAGQEVVNKLLEALYSLNPKGLASGT